MVRRTVTEIMKPENYPLELRVIAMSHPGLTSVTDYKAGISEKPKPFSRDPAFKDARGDITLSVVFAAVTVEIGILEKESVAVSSINSSKSGK